MWLAASGAAMMAAGVALRYATEADLEVPPPRSRRTAVQPRQSSSSGDAAGVAGASKAVDSPIHAVAAPSGGKPLTTTESSGNAPAGGPAKQTGPPRPKRHLRVLYASQLGHAKLWAERLCDDVQKIVVPMLDREAAKRAASASAGDAVPELVLVGGGPEPCSNIEDADDLAFEDIVLFVVSTYEGGAPPPAAVPFFNSLSEVANDFRIHKALLANVRYAILGIGDSAYDEDRWCAAAKGLDMLMASLNARRLGDVGLADSGAGAVVDTVYKQWLPELVSELKQNLVERKSTAKPQGKAEADLPVESDDESDANDELQDLEDLAGPAKGKPEPELQPGESPGMVTPNLRAALTKQGYKIIGSHSGVKLCRWTKAQMRGRGGCYKHTFYGIQSHRCMEMTPSLACANKCVFCWRHHSNPVGREWRWKTDAPEMLINGAIDNHTQMIKSLKGVPGVKPERMAEGLEVKHCALSLVGEPIMYPFINQFVDMLHERKISSFMVSNAQFPEQMRNLHPVTQMYISVDASNKDNLKAIDRPIFADFWERFLDSIDALRENGQRTVFRMTLVHGWNDDKAAPSEEGDDAEDAAKALEAAPEKPSSDGRPLHKRVTSTKEQEEKGAQIIGEYAELAKRGEPGLIEIKGVTFCGTSGASSLTMKNVPFHEEVLDFSRRMCDHPALEGKYGVACVHQHSCCVLIAKKDPYFDEENKQWRTWIDFPKFQELVVAGNPFTAEDYMLPTPSWALDNSPEEGFDPNEQRFKRNRPYNGQGC